MPEDTQARGIHPIVRLDYVVRMLGCPIPALIVASVRVGAGEPMPLSLWLGLFAYGLLWPQAAFLMARRSVDPRRTEHRLVLMDAAFGGAMVAVASFRAIPTMVLVTGFASLLASVGGPSLLAAGLTALLAGTGLTAWLGTGFSVASETPLLGSILSALMLVGFQLMMGVQTYRTARSFIESRRRMAEQREEIRARNAELIVAREEALQAAQAKAAFLATMSHEIRTPLNGALGMTRLLAETPLNAEQHDMLRTIQVSDAALLAIINDVLDYSKIESGHMDLEQEPVSVTETVEDALQLAAPRAREKGLELVCDTAPDVPDRIYGDPTRLRQVLSNLLGNAVKFTERGEVSVHVRLLRDETGEEPAEIGFAVQDTGIGIPADRTSALFAPFSQVDASTTRRYGGTGLGLAISKRLTEMMGGSIAVESVQGEGSTFRFSVRARRAPGADAGEVSPVALQGRHVLIVDDNDTNRRVLRGQLEGWGLETYSAEGAAEALGALESESRFDLAILDLHMPGVDGLTLARHIRDMPGRAALPLILLSSSPLGPKDDPERLFAARLMKPSRQSQLFDSIVGVLGGATRARPRAPDDAAQRRIGDRLPLSILVVDDNDVNRKVAHLVLRRFGYGADFAFDGRQAVDRVVHRALSTSDDEPYDLVLMDVHMPEMDGLDATRAIRAAAAERPGAPWPRIVAMTADAMHGDREACLAAGMDDCLTKPLDFDAVRAVLEHVADAVRAAGRTPRALPAPSAETPVEPSPSPATPRPPVSMDWSRLKELEEFDTPDGALIREAVLSFVDQVPGRLAELRRGATERDARALRESAHALRGAATNIGAVAVAESAEPLEQAGLTASFEELQPLIDDLSAALVRTLAELHRRPAGTPSAP